MNRRGFLKALSATVGGVALAEAIPFNRVWSFPKKIVIRDKPFWEAMPIRMGVMKPDAFYGRGLANMAVIYYNKEAVDNLKANLYFQAIAEARRLNEFGKGVKLELFR
jgi:hypothetical protein